MIRTKVMQATISLQLSLTPYKTVSSKDINDNHIGININSLHSIQSQGAGFYDDKNGMFKNMSLISREVMQVWGGI
jgi:hypothetical protein